MIGLVLAGFTIAEYCFAIVKWLAKDERNFVAAILDMLPEEVAAVPKCCWTAYLPPEWVRLWQAGEGQKGGM